MGVLCGASAEFPGHLTQHLLGAPAEEREKERVAERENKEACV